MDIQVGVGGLRRSCLMPGGNKGTLLVAYQFKNAESFVQISEYSGTNNPFFLFGGCGCSWPNIVRVIFPLK